MHFNEQTLCAAADVPWKMLLIIMMMMMEHPHSPVERGGTFKC